MLKEYRIEELGTTVEPVEQTEEIAGGRGEDWGEYVAYHNGTARGVLIDSGGRADG